MPKDEGLYQNVCHWIHNTITISGTHLVFGENKSYRRVHFGTITITVPLLEHSAVLTINYFI